MPRTLCRPFPDKSGSEAEAARPDRSGAAGFTRAGAGFSQELSKPEDMSHDLTDELKNLLIEGLRLEDLTPDDIDPDAPLFGAGLGLDSIDALELGVMLDRIYGVKITTGDERNPRIFASLKALAEFVAAHRGSARAGAQSD